MKVQTRPFPFFERPTLVPIFANWKKSREDFLLSGKRQKQKQHSVFVSHWAIREREPAQQLKWRHQAPSPRTALSLSAASCPGSGTVWPDLHFISLYFVHSLAICVLRYQKKPKRSYFGGLEMLKKFFIWINGSCLVTSCHFGFYQERSHRNTLFSDSRGNMHIQILITIF